MSRRTLYFYSPATQSVYAGNIARTQGDITIPAPPSNNDESLVLYWDNENREWKTKTNENYMAQSHDITVTEADELLQKSNAGDINSTILLRMLEL